jgi:mediator of RNA polymerase II transcription subunit 18
LIEESYRWWSNGIEFCLTRLFAVPPSPNPATPRQIANPATLEPVGTNWFLYVYAKVDPNPIATMPARMKEGQDTLVQIKKRFRGVFEFMVFDRRCRDTRLQEPRRA